MSGPDPVPLLDGVRVVDLGGEPAAIAGRVLADLGADVVLVETREGCALRALRYEWAAWGAGKRSVVVTGPDDPRLDRLLEGADVVIDTPGFPGSWELDAARAPHAAWVRVTPFGSDGPRARWRASDLGVMAASGNMWGTGYPDRAPVRCTYPTAYAHAGGEIAVAALTGLWANDGSGRSVDCSLQEIVFSANLSAISVFADTGERGRRDGTSIGGTRDVWATRDGFVSLGVRGGGPARVKHWAKIAELVVAEGIPNGAVLSTVDWATFNSAAASRDVLDAMLAALDEWLSRHTNQELYDLACEFNLLLAPVMSPREMLPSEQLEARGFFAPLGDDAQFPHRFFLTSSADGMAAPSVARSAAPELGSSEAVWPERTTPLVVPSHRGGPGAWSGVKILELGSGAAGPLATRYFTEHGATVLRVESTRSPDFLRVIALGRPGNAHGLEGSAMYDVLNAGKRDALFNLKDRRAVDFVRRLMVEWADAVIENFTPRVMKSYELDYVSVSAHAPSLVMVSTCLNGQTGPHRDYPGFGPQGAALSGYTCVTGFPDREPIGPSGTITDSLAPRYTAAAVAAAMLYRHRTGRGVYVDSSQVEIAVATLSPWLLEASDTGVIVERGGNRSRRAAPHGAFPCAAEGDIADRWVAIACWTDDEWSRLAEVIGIDDADLATLPRRQARIDEVEAAVLAWTSSRTRIAVAEELQRLGIEGVPVNDLGDIHVDPQVLHRDHFVRRTNPVTGPHVYDRSGFRVSGCESGYDRSGPTLGQDNAWVQEELLGLSGAERDELTAGGVFT